MMRKDLKIYFLFNNCCLRSDSKENFTSAFFLLKAEVLVILKAEVLVIQL
jgi:hypothetical protein